MNIQEAVRGAIVVAVTLFVAGSSSGQSPPTPPVARTPVPERIDFPIVIRFSEQFVSGLVPAEIKEQEPVVLGDAGDWVVFSLESEP